MEKQIIFSVLIFLMFMVLFSLVLAQGTGEGGAIVPQPSNTSTGGGGGVANDSRPYIDPEIYGVFNKSEWIRIIVYYKAEDVSNMSFKDLEEREEYIRNLTGSTFSYISETKMKIIQTSLEPGYFGAKITKEGFNILINDSKISKIYLDTMGSVADEDETISKNKSTTEEKEVLVNSETDKIKEEEMKLKSSWILIGVITIIFIILLCILINRRKR